ncbi:hypothetical protein YT1_0172 [Rhodococcus ruber]|nr:hypothetical protein YT1_0172 [Rhodococcus ruber]
MVDEVVVDMRADLPVQAVLLREHRPGSFLVEGALGISLDLTISPRQYFKVKARG